MTGTGKSLEEEIQLRNLTVVLPNNLMQRRSREPVLLDKGFDLLQMKHLRVFLAIGKEHTRNP